MAFMAVTKSRESLWKSRLCSLMSTLGSVLPSTQPHLGSWQNNQINKITENNNEEQRRNSLLPQTLPCWDLKVGNNFSRTGGVGISLRMPKEGKEKAAGSWLSIFSNLPPNELPIRLWDLSELVEGCGEKVLGSGADPSAVSPSQGKL